MSLSDPDNTPGTIYFVHVKFDQCIHMQALGFTDSAPFYGYGANPDEATRNVMAHLHAQGIGVTRLLGQPSAAQQQNPRRYLHIEQIYGLPPSPAIDAIRAKPWPQEWIEESVQKYERNRKGIAHSLPAVMHQPLPS